MATAAPWVSGFVSFPDLSLTCLNAAVFAVVQCLFFYFIASQQYKKLIQQKFRFAADIVNTLPDSLARDVCDTLEADGPATKRGCDGLSVAQCDQKVQLEADAQNMELLKSRCGPFVIIMLTIAAVLFVLSAWPQRFYVASAVQKYQTVGHWQAHHWWSAAMILACFSTELVFFFGFFSQYQVYGDLQILSKLLPAAPTAVA